MVHLLLHVTGNTSKTIKLIAEELFTVKILLLHLTLPRKVTKLPRPELWISTIMRLWGFDHQTFYLVRTSDIIVTITKMLNVIMLSSQHIWNGKKEKSCFFSRFENIKSLFCLFVYHETTPSFLGMDTKHNRWFTKTPSCLLQLLLKNCREGGKNYHDTLKSKRNTKPGTCRKNDILKKIDACAQVALKQLQDISLQQKWGKDSVKQTTSKKDSFMVNSAYLIFSTPQRHIQLIVHSISIVLPN